MENRIYKVLQLYYHNKESITDYNGLYKVFYDEDIMAEGANLINVLQNSINCHVETFKDLLEALSDLYAAYIGYQNTINGGYPISLKSIPDILYWWDSDKYYYADEHDKFWKLPIITDSDFIPYKSFTNEEYHIVYDLLLNDVEGSVPYDVVASYYNEKKTPIGRKVALKHWESIFQKVIDVLVSWKEKSKMGDVCIYIPFLSEYKETASHTISLFEMAIDATRLLRDTDGSAVELENPEWVQKVDDMNVIFDKWFDLLIDESESRANIVYDEMTRRGLVPNVKTQTKENLYRRYILGGNENEITQKQEIVEEKKQFMKDKAAVIYYMLKDEVDTRTIYKIVHYVCKGNADYKGADASDTLYTYILHADERLLDKCERIEYVKETLQKYKYPEDYITKNIK